MIILFGAPVSNFYNKVKLALLEKELAFQEEMTAPSQEEAAVSKSPMGKIPFIKDGEHYFCESSAIVEYLDFFFFETGYKNRNEDENYAGFSSSQITFFHFGFLHFWSILFIFICFFSTL